MKKLIKRNVLKTTAIALALSGVACGGDDEKKDEEEKPTGNTYSASFSDAEVGDQYVLIPFSTGDLTNVEGAGAETLTFNYSVGGEAAGLTMQPNLHGMDAYSLVTNSSPAIMDKYAFEHGKRLIVQLYDRNKGADQNPAIWNIARELDAVTSVATKQVAGMSLVAAPSFSYTNEIKRWIAAEPKTKTKNFSLNTQSTCTVEDDEVVRPDEEGEEDFADVSEVIEEDDFCLVIVDDPETLTTDEMKAAATEILSRYKTVIYKDDFTGATDFTFKPIIVVVDFKNTEDGNWPAESSIYNSINGAFIPGMTEITKHPMVYMASDLAKVLNDTSGETEKLKRFWLGTLAHEMQHAISDFIKVRKGDGSEETVAIEEGQAHFMEALFGYGQEVYDVHAKPFLDVFAFGTEPILRADDIFELSGRGAAYTLLYYLSSQKGGVTFTDGVVSGGDGLAYILDLVRDSGDEGPSHLSSEFGGNWVDTVASYLAALAVDGTDVEDIADEHTVDAPKTGVKDLGGGSDNEFGFRFNGGDVESHLGEYEAITGESFADDVEVTFYGFMPALYTVEDPEKTVTITSSVAENWGVTKVRVK